MSDNASDAPQSGIEAAISGGDSVIGLSMLGKTAAALGVILVIILVIAALLRRSNLVQSSGRGRLKVVGSTAVGTRERVVIVEVRDTWLVLGVGSGRVNKLHDMPAPDNDQAGEIKTGTTFEAEDSFATRFAKALRRNAGLG